VLKKGAQAVSSSGGLFFGWIFTGGSAFFLLTMGSTFYAIIKYGASGPPSEPR
jgi:hypothetical protein